MTNPTVLLINDFRAAAEEIEARLAPSAWATIASHNWIIMDDFGPLTFTLAPEGGKHRATCTGHGRAHKVNRFTQQDAEHLARACKARAAFWADAARELRQVRSDALECFDPPRPAQVLAVPTCQFAHLYLWKNGQWLDATPRDQETRWQSYCADFTTIIAA